jgi:two-component system cell cycle sensor histidine kinase/response regulator CckA
LILAVDDEHLALSLVKSMLERSGFTVQTAGSGEEALRIFGTEREHIGLVITDVVMPEMDGTALAERLLRQRPDLPVLFISGFSDRLEQIDAPILPKPFSSSALVRKVRALMSSDHHGAS